ncbi:LLM class flavin-dependent oxidoreductase [Cohnella lubricantis]|uniref:LLM class flavin-dependent oxidoreductase n=1 Tax=Cohnella lubricantis TaxID=2163172 RepID=A0A841T9C5_9BACL|nr:LLM class flavin-dependent oxidoreductase [Cohnella lubricantis]MBB6676625.1 LLM class flavin-dependent oxidoreductase [Cohnella lubricantis]MBP2117364.1 luciferase family oxidoreductase group 1 [Cohnella lubricantis]
MILSVLDQSQICEGRTASQTLAETTRLAQLADELGYHRYWVSEHHASRALAHSSPEVLIAHLAAATSRIRVGSGGIMLPHYSAYKVAENFKLLEALHPGRIDLGLGRAPGGMPLSTRALQEGKFVDIDRYPEQVDDLNAYLYDKLPAGHRFAGLQASPLIPTAPEVWLLGSSLGTAQIAARKGANYAYAQFFGVPGSEDAVHYYKENFKPSERHPEPRALAAVMVICADTEEEASRLATSTDLFFLSLEQGRMLDWFPSVETAESYPYTDYDRERIRAVRQRRIIGTPAQVRARLLNMQDQFGIDEFMVVTLTHDFEARLKSYRLLAEAFGM